MRRVAIVLGLGLVGACSLLGGDDPPDRSCRSNGDCFAAQGEVCDPVSKTCVVETDGGSGVVEDDEAVAEPEGAR